MNFANTSLFVGDLPKFCTENDLEQLFVSYGPILDLKIKRNVNTGKTLSYGFVTLSSERLASDAIKNLDGAMFLGRKLRIRWAMYNAKQTHVAPSAAVSLPSHHNSAANTHHLAGNNVGNVINSVYVRFVTPKVNCFSFCFFPFFLIAFFFSFKVDHYVTEEDLHGVFDPFGCVLDVTIKESSVDPVWLYSFSISVSYLSVFLSFIVPFRLLRFPPLLRLAFESSKRLWFCSF
jgi:RNA recognition motif-containing protein